MDRRQIFTAVAIVALINGLFSPLVAMVLSLMPFWMPEFVPASLPIALMMSAMITAFGTLLISGIPAALFERLTGQYESTEFSLYIWLGAAVLMTLPALPTIVSLF